MSRKSKRKKALLGVVMTTVMSLGGWNYLGAYRPVATRLAQDSRNQSVSLWAYHQYGLLPGTLVLDLRGLGEEAAMIDIMRAVLQSAQAHQGRRFDRVLLAYRGVSKFMLDGEYFQKLGREFESQNPLYLVRTFPENVRKLDGASAYSTWTGGALGVFAGQMDDLGQFMKDWFIDELAKREKSSR